MIRPSMKEAKALAEGYSVLPISLEIFSDIRTPIEILKVLKSKSNKCYLLESVEGGERWNRYSFLGFNPKLSVSCINGEMTIANKKIKTDNPNSEIRKILNEYKSPSLDFLPTFTGGLVGYISYEYSKYKEKSLKFTETEDGGFNDLELMLFDNIIVFDHLRQKIIIIVNIKTDDFENNYIDGVVKLKEIESIIKLERSSDSFNGEIKSQWKSVFSKEDFCEGVKKIKQHIFDGDIFQAVLSNKITADFSGDLLGSYRVLRTINPSPYMFYLDFDGRQIAGASPETLLKLNNSKINTFPIAGSCKRGENKEEDEALIESMLKDEKELSEHNMLVDLGRNDIGKVSEFGSVKVENYKEVMRFSHISHIASTVSGTLRSELDQLDAIEAILPAGTLSGAPKIRAMQIISEIEQRKRGVYAGAIGYIDFSGNMDMCIGIRMATLEGGKVSVSAGAGIVNDSIPENEWNEAINKSQAMIDAIERSKEAR